MKNLMFCIFTVLLFSCTNGGKKSIKNSINDTITELEDVTETVETASDIQSESTKAFEQEKPILYAHLWHPNQRNESGYLVFDTIIGDWKVSSRIQETLDSKEYVTAVTGGGKYDINDHIVDYDIIFYGRIGRIVFNPINSLEQKSDTVYINRESLTKRFPFEDTAGLKDWALFTLYFKEVRNDSIIFSADFGVPDSGFGYVLELKFNVHNPVGTLVVEDITSKIWSFEDELNQ
ncbi:MAG: hypothetical protein K2J10_02595 [Muribaculaceae bacterium]|nr:hypothetical protein [Muribaculaceae bacterium]